MGLDSCEMTRIHHYSIIQRISTALKMPCSAYSPLLPRPLATMDLTVAIVLLSAECHVLGRIQSAAFPDGLLSLSKMHVHFLCVFSELDRSCAFSTEYSSFVWMDHSLSIRLPKDILVAFRFRQL